MTIKKQFLIELNQSNLTKLNSKSIEDYIKQNIFFYKNLKISRFKFI